MIVLNTRRATQFVTSIVAVFGAAIREKAM